jgi:hypothetical protein
MTQINPITGSGMVQSSAAQRVQGDDKAAQMRRADVRRNNTPSGDTYEPQVASPTQVDPVSDQAHQNRQQRRDRAAARRRPPQIRRGDGESQLDVTA